MKIYELKKYVYKMTKTTGTKELRKVKPELVKGKDLRKKASWFSIYNTLKLINDFQSEQITKNIENKYGFQELDLNSSVSDLIKNIQAVVKISEDIEEQLSKIEQKYSK